MTVQASEEFFPYVVVEDRPSGADYPIARFLIKEDAREFVESVAPGYPGAATNDGGYQEGRGDREMRVVLTCPCGKILLSPEGTVTHRLEGDTQTVYCGFSCPRIPVNKSRALQHPSGWPSAQQVRSTDGDAALGRFEAARQVE